ncbi:hypothetical protein EAH72_33930 [Pseudomonas caspiana]|nr:hypothetical protein EAH72_33930 [Pseudomonas caspiana]
MDRQISIGRCIVSVCALGGLKAQASISDQVNSAHGERFMGLIGMVKGIQRVSTHTGQRERLSVLRLGLCPRRLQ